VLQDAINAASPGATVVVCPGTWAETITVTGDLIITGREGPEATIIDAGSPAASISTVTVRRGAVLLEGLTITGGTGTQSDGNSWGGGVYAGTADSLELSDCVITGNSADFGGGLVGPSMHPATATIRDSSITDNQAAFAAGGFLLFRGILEGSEIADNSAPVGGGGAVFYWDVIADATTSVHDNSATEAGGGILVWDEGQLELTGTSVTGNSAGGAGGAIFIEDGAASGVACDLGSDPDDNSPDDVSVQGPASQASYRGGSPVDFSCDSASGGCTGF
jgi:hypothetical protein